MNYHYYKMLIDNLDSLIPGRRLYTNNWLNSIINEEYSKSIDDVNKVIYYKFLKKINNLGRTGHALIVIVISKNEEYNFQNDKLDLEIENLYKNYQYEKRVRKQIVIQFKKYPKMENIHFEKLREIINYKNGENVFINIPVGYFVEENKVYYLRPKNNYYNKYHFFATKLIEELTYTKEDFK